MPISGTIGHRPVSWSMFLWVLAGCISLGTTYIATHGMDVHKDAATVRELADVRERLATLENEMSWRCPPPTRGPYGMPDGR